MLIGRPIQIMAVEWIPLNQTINQKKQNYNQSKGDISIETSEKEKEKGLDKKDLEPEFQREVEEFKFLYNIEVWHKGCVSKNAKADNNVRDQVKHTPKKIGNSIRHVSQVLNPSPEIVMKKTIHEESHNDTISSSFFLSPPFLDNRMRSKSQSSSFSSISTPPRSNSRDEINLHPTENSLLIGSPGKNSGSRPCSGGQRRSSSIDMTLRGLNLFNLSNNKNMNNEDNIPPPGQGQEHSQGQGQGQQQGQGQGQSNFVGSPDGPSPRIPLPATHKETPKNSKKK